MEQSLTSEKTETLLEKPLPSTSEQKSPVSEEIKIPKITIVQEPEEPIKKKSITEEDDKEDYYLSANFISRLFFHWAFKLIKLSHQVNLELGHLGTLKGANSSKNYMQNFYHVYNDLDYKSKSASLLKTMIRSNISMIIRIIIIGLVITGFNVLTMIEFREYVILFKGNDPSKRPIKDFLITGLTFLILKLVNIFLNKKLNEYQNYVGYQSGVEINCLIFDKLLRVSPSSRHNKAEHGEIVNFVQVDSEQLTKFILISPALINVPISIIAYSILLFKYLGFAYGIGLFVLIIFLVINYFMHKKFNLLYKEKQANIDKRLKLTTAILFNLKVLKLYSWDEFFYNKLNDARENELATIKQIFNFRNVNQTLFWLSPVMTTIFTLGSYELLSKEKKIENIFVSLGVLNSLQEPVRTIAQVYTSLIETYVSMNRIEKFINQEDVNENQIISNDKKLIDEGVAIKIENGTFSWGVEQKDCLNSAKKDKDRPVTVILKDINLTVKKGEFVCIIGEVGSGKSSLLNCLLNNMIHVTKEEKAEYEKNQSPESNHRNEIEYYDDVCNLFPDGKFSNIIMEDEENISHSSSGSENEEKHKEKASGYNKVYVNGTISYVSQKSWIQNTTLRNNILFCHEYDEKKYNKIVQISELIPDLQTLKGGDMTEIGEKGINLSGGQKARVSIARALYKDSDIYLFDDPISALDANVGKNVINNCLCDYLKNKTRILVTHAIQYCKKADKIIYMKDGQFAWEGNYNELSKQAFYKAMVLQKEKKKKTLRNSRNGDINFVDATEEEKWNELSSEKYERKKFRRKTVEELFIELRRNSLNAVFYDNSSTRSSSGERTPKREKKKNNKSAKEVTKKRKGTTPNNNINNISNSPIKGDSIAINVKENPKSNVPSGDSNNMSNEELIKSLGNKEGKGVKRITKDEKIQQGKLKGNVYLTYFKNNGGVVFVICLIIILVAWQCLKCGSDLWLVKWKSSEETQQKMNWKDFLIYSGLGVSAAIFVYLRLLAIYFGSMNNSRRIHQEMLKHLIRAPINLYHDTVPKGQIFNRLSNDMDKIDVGESYLFFSVTSYGFNLIGQVVVCAIFQPFCLILVPFILVSGFYTMKYYLNCSRQLSRIKSVSRSPMMNSVNETIAGSLTIRAFNMNENFKNDFRKKADDFMKTRIFSVGVMNWYTLMLDIYSYCFVAFLILFSIFTRQKFKPAIIGILLNYCVQIQDELIRFLSSRSNLENDMVGLERCIEYTKIVTEKPDHLPIDEELGQWPKEGSVKFINYTVQYRPDTEIVLKNINFEINPREKVGVVGRTGSGKSTLALCLFRILEAKEGQILIDDVDISTIGLHKLRSNITIIPQDPTLMEGTLRFNIDPLNNYTDEEIENVMKSIGFWYICDKNLEDNKDKPDNEKGLNMMIVEDGGNISIGEKQLICITRAILRKSKIIVMDEATASIDVNTEKIIQKTINEMLHDSTIITIAHRIKTIMNSNRILLLENGEIKEFDSPHNLLKNKNSLFYELYTKSK